MDAIVSGSYDSRTLVKRVLDHMSSQNEPIGGNPPTYGDLFRGKARDGPMGHLGRPPEPNPRWNDTPQVSSVVQVLGKAKAVGVPVARWVKVGKNRVGKLYS